MKEYAEVTVTLSLDVRRISGTTLALTSPVIPGIYVAGPSVDECREGVQKAIDALTEFHRTDAAVKEERRACASIASDWKDGGAGTAWGKSAETAASEIADAIRARSGSPSPPDGR